MRLKKFLIITLTALIVTLLVGCAPSAYDIAKKNGYEGSEEQWLVSLRGNDGADGADLNIYDIYQTALDSGFEGSYLDFLDKYLDFEQSADNSAAITKGLRSAVLIECTIHNITHMDSVQAGAGVVYRLNKTEGSAYIITNYHVVYSTSLNTVSNDITITPYGSDKKISAEYIGGSAIYDIAVLRTSDAYFTTDLPLAVSIANYDVCVGQTAIAIGNPAGYGISATTGIVSVESEYLTMNAIDDRSQSVQSRAIRTDAAVNSGNSGGGLFDADGNLIGIVNAKSADTSYQNMGYAIPVSVATAVAQNIINNHGTFLKGTLGITVESVNPHSYLSDGKIRIAETVTVKEVEGASVGKVVRGDIIRSISIDGVETTVTRSFHITDVMLLSSPGDVVTLKVLRGNTELTVSVTCK